MITTFFSFFIVMLIIMAPLAFPKDQSRLFEKPKPIIRKDQVEPPGHWVNIYGRGGQPVARGKRNDTDQEQLMKAIIDTIKDGAIVYDSTPQESFDLNFATRNCYSCGANSFINGKCEYCGSKP